MAETTGSSRLGNGPGQQLAVERSQIFERAAAAGHDNHVHRARLVEKRDARGNFQGGGLALHRGRVKLHVQRHVPAPGHIEEVPNDRARGRSNDPNTVREGGQRLLTIRCEKPFLLQPGFQLLEGDLQRACAYRLHELGHQLHLAPLLVNRDPPAHQDLQSIFRPEAQQHRLTAKQHHRQLGIAVLQREVNMTRRGGAVVGDLAFHPHIGVLPLDVVSYLAHQLADPPHPPEVGRRSLRENQSKLAQ